METILTNWTLIRWIRLGLGLLISFQGIVNKDALSGMLGAFLLYQAIANAGCCGIGGCDIPSKNSSKNQIEDIEFEEIKEK